MTNKISSSADIKSPEIKGFHYLVDIRPGLTADL